MRRLARNAAQCAKCKTVIESKHRHDFVACACGAIFIDGGLDYIRGGGNQEDFISLVEWAEPYQADTEYDGQWERDLYGV